MNTLRDSRGRLCIFFLSILITACSSGITGTFLNNQGYYAPLTDSVRQQADDGYIQIDSSHAGNPLIQTVMVKLEPSFSQKVRITKESGVFPWCIALLVIAWGLIIFGIVYSSHAGKFMGAVVWIFILAIALHFGAFALIDWAHTKEISMSKMQYDFLQHEGQLTQYIDQLLFQ
jgi:hypothetical protein